MASTASDVFSMRSGYYDPDSVYIPKDEYDRLVQISHHYASLRENLIQGGVNDETCDLLSNVVAANQTQSTTIRNEAPYPAYERHVTEPSRPARNSRYNHQSNFPPTFIPRGHTVTEWTETDESYEDESTECDTQAFFGGGQENEHQADYEDYENTRRFVREADRTIQISSLPDGTTHADITAVVRGGQLLDVYLRYKDQSASVSFLYEEDAYAFYEHVRKYDLYIKQKRVDISWSDRQFTLPDHISRKIQLGATRNLVIRRCKAEHNEESVRDDLEHIHNLKVAKVDFRANSCFISTNSVACATFARTCMMSRLKYKGSRVEFDLDECDLPLVAPAPKRTPSAPLAKTPASVTNSMANRFHLLDTDD